MASSSPDISASLKRALTRGRWCGRSQPVVHVAQERAPGEGAGVAVPAVGEALELLAGGGGEDLVEEAVVARFVELVEEEGRGRRHGARMLHRARRAWPGRLRRRGSNPIFRATAEERLLRDLDAPDHLHPLLALFLLLEQLALAA